MDAKPGNWLRQLPSVDQLLQKITTAKDLPRAIVTHEIRAYLDQLRQTIVQGNSSDQAIEAMIAEEKILATIEQNLLAAQRPKISRAINATGVILHTGLGRAPLPQSAIENMVNHLQGYTVLEVDRDSGERSQRDLAVRDLLCKLTGAEDATVANNNAGAVLLALAALARGKEVIVSRGQLVEIGGSFRVPEIMKESGATLIEVGCTNRTHLADYQSAISPNTAAILHVHTSNFKVVGFTHEVPLADLSPLAHQHKLYLLQDAGSGAICQKLLPDWGKHEEPVIAESIAQGADLVTFSGDKLLGACQAGIIVGKKSLVQAIRTHPLARALRADKITFSILEATLKHYFQDPATCIANIPALWMHNTTAEIIHQRALRIAEKINFLVDFCQVEVQPSVARSGSGAYPIAEIPSFSVVLRSQHVDLAKLARQLRLHDPAVFTRVHDHTLFIDPRTLFPQEDEEIVEIMRTVCQQNPEHDHAGADL